MSSMSSACRGRSKSLPVSITGQPSFNALIAAAGVAGWACAVVVVCDIMVAIRNEKGEMVSHLPLMLRFGRYLASVFTLPGSGTPAKCFTGQFVASATLAGITFT